jgi:AraC family transcriptional regulator
MIHNEPNFKMKRMSLTRREYEKRLNNVLAHIDSHLHEELRLNTLAEVACFSPYHFHRIFSALIGEPPAEFVRRLRIEKAANLLLNQPLISITEIAFSCGFSSSALFARQFRERFGSSPSRWRELESAALVSKKSQIKSKKIKSKSKPRKASDLLRMYISGDTKSPWRSKMEKKKQRFTVEVKHVPSMRIAYVKHLKGYEDSAGIGAAYEKLFLWAGPRGFMGSETKVLGISLDNPDITPKEKCRYYACITVSPDAKADGEVGIMDTKAGMYAVAGFRGKSDIFRKAYGFLYGEWLPESGYQPDDSPAFEVYTREPENEADPTFSFDLYVPAKPL